MINLTRLRQVVALAEHGSFSRAAATLNISQPALSKSIQSLEAALGVRLFDRQTRGVVPTEFGRLVVAHSRKLVEREGQLLKEIRQLAGLESGHLDVALGPVPCVMSGYAAAGVLMQQHDRLSITLRAVEWREVTQLVLQRRVDLGVAELADAVLDERLSTEPIAPHRLQAFCRPGHPLLAGPVATLRRLLDYPWANTRIPARIAAGLPREPTAAGSIDALTGDFVPTIDLALPMHLARLVRESDLIVFGTYMMVEHELAAGQLLPLPSDELRMRTSYGFILPRDRTPSSAVQAFMQAMRDEEQACRAHESHLEHHYAVGSQATR